MFNSPATITVEPGRVYREKQNSRMVSLAHVISIIPDTLGIPHVHFILDIHLPSGVLVREEKTNSSPRKFHKKLPRRTIEPMLLFTDPGIHLEHLYD